MSYADLNQCKGCACFTDGSHGGLVDGLCIDCRNPEPTNDAEEIARNDAAKPGDRFTFNYALSAQQEEELEVMRSRGEI